jgi:hypothetical protein
MTKSKVHELQDVEILTVPNKIVTASGIVDTGGGQKLS